MPSIRAFLKQIPTPLGGLALGTASLGAAWTLMPNTPAWIAPSLAAIAGLALLSLWLKLMLLPKLCLEELRHPVIGSVMPTICMGSMIVAAALKSIDIQLAQAIWLGAIAAHLLFAARFLTHQLRDFDIKRLVPSWFVPPIGIVVGAVTSSGLGFDALAQGLVWMGLALFALALPIVLYRLVFVSRADKAAWPTLAIMGAPASLCLAGYMTAFDSFNPYILLILTPLAMMMTLLTYILLTRLLLLPFSPGYAAFTFPLVIGATALLKLEAAVGDQMSEPVLNLIHVIGRVELYVATAVVGYVALRYIHHFVFASRKQKTQNIQTPNLNAPVL